ncbi:MAG TPA: choice-of-anchor Q domain-containing protein [Chloroflexota bacterium]|nr:choice-of-anchor Q domain-containing protein [Chloroflexota bacterium]
MTLKKYRVVNRHRWFIVLSMIIWVSGLSGNGRIPLAPSTAQAGNSIIYVHAGATGGSNSGDSWANAYTSLQTALTNAVSGQEIWVAAGVYKPTDSPADRDATFPLKNGVAVYGGFAGTETALNQRNWDNNRSILSGDIDNNDIHTSGVVADANHINGANSYHVVTGNGTDNTAILDGLIITAGQANDTSDSCPEGCGGGLYLRNSMASLRNIIFSGNRADENGGGLYTWDGSHPTLTHVTFSGNYALWGGGIANWGGNLNLTNVTFSQNRAVHEGGGMTGWSANPSLTNVRFIGNSVTWYGGGMYNDRDTTPVLTNVIFSGNRAESGGGLYNWDGSSPILTNVTFSGNHATNAGGGLYNRDNSNPLILNSIFWNNQDNSGIGTASASIYNWNSVNFPSTPAIYFSLVQGCNPGSIWVSDCGTDGGDNLADTNPLFVTTPNPILTPTTTGNLRLQASSPAINMGNNDFIPDGVTTDLNGWLRIIDTAVDLGAYEFAPSIFLPIVVR